MASKSTRGSVKDGDGLEAIFGVKTLGLETRAEGEEASHELPSFEGRKTLKLTKTTRAEKIVR